jgi:pyridoxamine 5'-phosphate oxidase
MDRKELPFTDLGDDPTVEFLKWYGLAGVLGSLDFDAMTLATASKSGVPHARTVLYKGLKDGGVKFYTNYESAKGKELKVNSRAALVFYWSAIYRQVRIEGKVKKLSPQESDDYFHRRPRESQLGALVSRQSQPIKSFSQLDEKFAALEKKYVGKEIPRPAYWGGYVLIPKKFEFWFGRTRRLHLRIAYAKRGARWVKTLLSP